MITHNRSIAQTADRVLQVSDGNLTDLGGAGNESYLSLVPISAKVRKRQNRMTILCVIISIFLVTAILAWRI